MRQDRNWLKAARLAGTFAVLVLAAPALGKLGPGDRVHVEGSVAEMTMCQQGTTVVVTKIEPAR